MKKILFVLMIVISFQVFCQKDTFLLTTTYDEFKDEYYTFYKSSFENNASLYMTIDSFIIKQSGFDISYINFIFYGLEVCHDNGEEIIILFEDKTRISFKTDTKYNCKGIVSFSLKYGSYNNKYNRKNLEYIGMLSEKTIKGIRIYATDKNYTIYLSKSEQEKFCNAFKCFIPENKKTSTSDFIDDVF